MLCLTRDLLIKIASLGGKYYTFLATRWKNNVWIEKKIKQRSLNTSNMSESTISRRLDWHIRRPIVVHVRTQTHNAQAGHPKNAQNAYSNQRTAQGQHPHLQRVTAAGAIYLVKAGWPPISNLPTVFARWPRESSWPARCLLIMIGRSSTMGPYSGWKPTCVHTGMQIPYTMQKKSLKTPEIMKTAKIWLLQFGH